MKAWACVGRHGKIFYTAVTNDEEKQDRLEIYFTEKAALKNALGNSFVREVTVTIHKPSKDSR